jgi:hypothetical protein
MTECFFMANFTPKVTDGERLFMGDSGRPGKDT